MTGAEIKQKIDAMLAKCHAMKPLTLAQIKQMMNSPTLPEGEKIYYRLEYTYRVYGGKDPTLIILEKMQKEWNCEFSYHPAQIGIVPP